MPHYYTSDGSTQDQGRFEIIRDYPPPALEHRWRDCLKTADFATHYTTPEYFREPFFRGMRPFAVLSMIGKEVAAICTGVHDGRLLKCGLSERPQVAISRAADRDSAAAGLTAGLREESRSGELVDVFSWSKLPGMARLGFREREQQGAVVLDLCLGSDALFRKFSKSRRKDIRNAIKAGVTVDLAASSADIAGCYEVYCQWSAQKGLPAQPRDVVEKALSLQSNRGLFVARHRGKIVASLIVRFAPGGVMEAAGISSLEEKLYLHPNDLLHLRAIEWACQHGLQRYSLGGSHLFLRKFGGSLVPTYRYRLDRTFLQTFTIRDITSEFIRIAESCAPAPLVAFGRRLRDSVTM